MSVFPILIFALKTQFFRAVFLIYRLSQSTLGSSVGGTHGANNVRSLVGLPGSPRPAATSTAGSVCHSSRMALAKMERASNRAIRIRGGITPSR